MSTTATCPRSGRRSTRSSKGLLVPTHEKGPVRRARTPLRTYRREGPPSREFTRGNQTAAQGSLDLPPSPELNGSSKCCRLNPTRSAGLLEIDQSWALRCSKTNTTVSSPDYCRNGRSRSVATHEKGPARVSARALLRIVRNESGQRSLASRPWSRGCQDGQTPPGQQKPTWLPWYLTGVQVPASPHSAFVSQMMLPPGQDMAQTEPLPEAPFT